MSRRTALHLGDLPDGSAIDIETEIWRGLVFLDIYEGDPLGSNSFCKVITPAQAREIAAALIRAAEMMEEAEHDENG